MIDFIFKDFFKGLCKIYWFILFLILLTYLILFQSILSVDNEFWFVDHESLWLLLCKYFCHRYRFIVMLFWNRFCLLLRKIPEIPRTCNIIWVIFHYFMVRTIFILWLYLFFVLISFNFLLNFYLIILFNILISFYKLLLPPS